MSFRVLTTALVYLSMALSGAAFAATLTEIVVPGLSNATATAINNRGAIVGYGTGSSGIVGFLDVNGTFTFVSYPGSQSTKANGINDLGDIVGTYTDDAGSHGFEYSGGTYTTIDAPSQATLHGPEVAQAGTTSLVAINNEGRISGNAYVPAWSSTNGFFYVPGNGVASFEYDEASPHGWVLRGLNNSGEIVGTGTSSPVFYGNYLWFRLSPVSSPPAPGSSFNALNDLGNVALSSSSGLSYLLSTGADTSLNVVIQYPGAASTVVLGLNASEVVVGVYVDNAGQSHAFTGRIGPPALCTISGSAGPPRQLTFTVQDKISGLSGIAVSNSANSNVNIPPFPPGTTAPVYVTATASDPSQQATARITATDQAGWTTTCTSVISAGPPQWGGLGGVLTSNLSPGLDQNGTLEVFGVGSDGGLWHKTESGPGGFWEPSWVRFNSADAPALDSDPIVVTDTRARLQVFTKGGASQLGSNDLWYAAQDPPGSWANVFSLQSAAGGPMAGRPAVINDSNGNLAILTRRDSDSAVLWSVEYVADGSQGGGMFLGSLGGVVTSSPTAVLDADGNIQVYAIGTDNALWNDTITEKNYAAPPLGPWNSIGGSLKGEPQVVSSSGTLYALARGTDDALWFSSQAAGSSWVGWQSLGGVLIDNPKAVVNSDGRVEVFVVGTDNAVWHKMQSSAGSSQWSDWSTLGGYVFGDIYPIVDSTALVNIFVVGGDNGGWLMQQSLPGIWQ